LPTASPWRDDRGECDGRHSGAGRPGGARVRGPLVVGFDGSPAAVRALDLAATAVAPDGQLLVVTIKSQVRSHGVLSEPLIESGVGSTELLDAALERLADDAPSSLDVKTIVRSGDPGNALVEVAREQRARLIALGGRGDDFEARVLLGSTAAYVAGHAHCDVLVVR
jgi:nucleotide-binding universal stress UspA family protein